MINPNSSLLKRLRLPLALLTIVILVGTCGYVLLWNNEQTVAWLELTSDAFFMTLITITTVGYGEVRELEHSTRLFTIFVALFGIASLSYIFSTTMEYLVSRYLRDPLETRKMQKMIQSFKDHIIVAGYGQMGRQVCLDLLEQQETFVLIDIDSGVLRYAIEKDIMVVEGDASQDEVLSKAGISKAKALIATTSDDATNAFVVMSARALSEKVRIVARAETDDSVKKLLRAGADTAVNPYTLGSHRLTRQVLQPAVIDFFESSIGSSEIQIQEILVSDSMPLSNHSIMELDLRRKTGVTVLTIFREQKAMFPPPLNQPLKEGDRVLLMATTEQFHNFESWLKPKSP